MEFIGSPPLHLLARLADGWLLLPRSTLDHVLAQHGHRLPGGSRFSDSFLPPAPSEADVERFAANAMGLIRSGLESGFFRHAGPCHEFIFPGMSVGENGAVIGAEPESFLLKEEDGKGVLVPAVNRPASPTDKLSAILLPADPAKLPPDLTDDPRLKQALAAGTLRVVASFFPGVCVLPDGRPFPRSTQMIDSPVALCGEGIKCSFAIAKKMNAAMARLAAPPPLAAVERMAASLDRAERRLQEIPQDAPTSHDDMEPPRPIAPPKAEAFEPMGAAQSFASGEAQRASKTASAPSQAMDLAPPQDISPPPAEPPQPPTPREPQKRHVASAGRFVGCVPGPQGPQEEMRTDSAAKAVIWAQRHCSRDASIRIQSAQGAIAIFSRWVGPEGPLEFGDVGATCAGPAMVAGVDHDIDQAWIESLTRAVCDKLGIGAGAPKRLSP